ncbi:MAG: hypothetical protein M3R47_07375 [Chloroflexota bacterium]|nr:hypothetical protein [Chloroflexota bacterium]
MFFLVLVLLVSCEPSDDVVLEEVTASIDSTKTPAPIADNFSFIFEESSCGHLPWLNILDTSTGILIHTPLDETKSIEIAFVLSKNEIEMIYQKIIAKDFFGYPSEVRVIGETPPSTFRLKVINGDGVHQVKWTSDLDNSEPNYPETDRLFDLYIFIQQIIHSHSEYPEPTSGCA